MKAILRRALQSEFLVLILCGVYFAALAPVTPGFATPGNLGNVLAAMFPLLVVATGQTLVLITAGIDLSVTSVIALASVAGALVMTGDGGLLGGSTLAVPAGLATMLATGAIVGLANGFAVTRFHMPPFIVTLTTMMFFSGLAVWLTKSRSVAALPPGFLAAGGNAWSAGLVALAVAGAAHLVLTRTLLGRWFYAVGQNPAAAHVSGVPNARVLAAAYLASGLCAAVAAVLVTGRLESGSPVHWRNNLLDVVGAAVIGGTSLYGGKGKVVWTVFGVLLLALIDNSLNLLNLSHFTIMMAKGGVILAAALLDAARARALQP